MKLKEYIILGIIIAGLGAYLLLRSGDHARYELPALPEAAADQISKIEIDKGDEAVVLVRSDDQWLIGENRYPADASKMAEILSVLQDLTLTALVSETGAYARYDLTDDSKIGVRAWSGDRLVREMSIGKTADTYQHTFVRIGENPNVYHARNNFRRTFDQTADDLRDKTVLSFDVSDITAIDLASGEKHLSLSLEETPIETPDNGDTETEPDSQPKTVWKGEDGTPADTDAVQRLLSQLAYLTCSGYLDGVKKDLSAPVCTITLKGKQDHFLSLFEPDSSGTGCPGISSQNDYPFTLGETAFSRLNESLETLFGADTKPEI